MPTRLKLRPLNDCILIDPEPDPDYAEQLGSSLIIPDAYKLGPTDPPKWGRVAALGATCTNIVAVGDRVLYGKFSWAKVQLSPDKHLVLVRECDILAVDECA